MEAKNPDGPRDHGEISAPARQTIGQYIVSLERCGWSLTEICSSWANLNAVVDQTTLAVVRPLEVQVRQLGSRRPLYRDGPHFGEDALEAFTRVCSTVFHAGDSPLAITTALRSGEQ